MSEEPQIEILAASSAGGHFDQLMLLRDAFGNHPTAFASTDPTQAQHYGIADCIELFDANQHTPNALLRSYRQTGRLVARLRPRIIISTGAAPGLFCLLHGKRHDAYTIWIDSVANSTKMSLSGRLAAFFSDEVLTQHKHLAKGSITFAGRVI